MNLKLTPKLLPPLVQLWAGQGRVVHKGALDPLADCLILTNDLDLRVLQIGDVEACRVARASFRLSLTAALVAPRAGSVALVLDDAHGTALLNCLLPLLVGRGRVGLVLIALTLRDACATAHL